MKAISANSITGELMARPRYEFVSGALIAAIVNDTIDIINEEEGRRMVLCQE